MSEPKLQANAAPVEGSVQPADPVVLVGRTLERDLSGVPTLAQEPDEGPLDAQARADAVITLDVACPDCDWCGGQVAVLSLNGAEQRIGYDPGHAEVVVGRDLQQAGFLGLSDKPGLVCVGAPPHPACAAMNVAYQAGFTAIEIAGAPPGLRDHLKPFLDRAAEKLSVTFT